MTEIRKYTNKILIINILLLFYKFLTIKENIYFQNNYFEMLYL